MGLLALHLKSYAESYSCLSKHRPGLSKLNVGAGFKPALPPPLDGRGEKEPALSPAEG